jgi:type IV pilus assembly protein PilF
MMRPRSAVVLALAAVLAAGGCTSMSRKFTFMRPEISRKDSRQVAPEYDVQPDSKARRGGQTARDRVALAEQRMRAGQLAEAETEARAALKADPKSPDAYTILAVLADERGQAAQAGGYYAKAAELAPARGGVLNNYGAWLCGNGRAGESLAWFDRALADPSYASTASAHANAGACALDAGQDARAERDLRMALAQDPTNATALAAMARSAYRAGRYLEARAFSERRLAAAPPTKEILQLASQIEQKLGDNQAAARYTQQMTAQSSQEAVRSGETGEQ